MRRSAPILSLITLLALTLCSAPLVYAQAKGDPNAGADKAGMCAGCHGISGWRNAYPAYQVPKLGGQHADYLVSALMAYKNGQRQHAGMQGIAASLSEQDIADLAAFLSTTAPSRSAP